jgi:hypothetical protein
MILSKRERVIVGIVAVCVTAFLLDTFVIQRMQDLQRKAEDQRPNLEVKKQDGESALSHQKALAPKWKEIVDGGLKHDPTEAESQVLHALADWSREAGVKIVAMKPERAVENESQKKALQEIAFVASGTGTMSGITRLLYRIETAKIPLRIKNLQMGSRKEGTNDLSVELRLSTLYESAAQPAAKTTEATTAVAASKTGGAP